MLGGLLDPPFEFESFAQIGGWGLNFWQSETNLQKRCLAQYNLLRLYTAFLCPQSPAG